jgi:hypothetical protein
MNHNGNIHEIGHVMIAKFMAGEHLNEGEKEHLAGCSDCMKRVLAALDHKAKTQPPPPDADRARSEALRALDRVRQLYLREFGISLTGEPSTAKAS